MPIVRNWVEELIYEWLLLEEYMVLPNVRLKSKKGGGVPEADILGLKLVKNAEKYELEIIHVEAGELVGSFEENREKIHEKFSSERIKTIVKMIGVEYSKLDVSQIIYRPVYIARYVPKKQVEDLRNALKEYRVESSEEFRIDKIEFRTLEEIIMKVMRDIDSWKEKQKEMGYRKTERITLPESLWLLNLIDFMKHAGLCKLSDEKALLRKD